MNQKDSDKRSRTSGGANSFRSRDRSGSRGGAQESNASPPRRERRKAAAESTYSLSSQKTKKTNSSMARELAITKKINDVFKQRIYNQDSSIYETIFNDDLRIYHFYRKQYDVPLMDLEKERTKILRLKKSKKQICKRLKQNTREKLYVLCMVLKKTYLHYQNRYYESDHFRLKKLYDIKDGIVRRVENQEPDGVKPEEKRRQKLIGEETRDGKFISATERAIELQKQVIQDKADLKEKLLSSPKDTTVAELQQQKNDEKKAKEKRKKIEKDKKAQHEAAGAEITEQQKRKLFIEQLKEYINSPFKEDKRFAINYVASVSRENIEESEDILNALFYDKIFDVLIEDPLDHDDYVQQLNISKAFEILSNMLEQSPSQRKKVTKGPYLQKVFEKMEQIIDDFWSQVPEKKERAEREEPGMSPAVRRRAAVERHQNRMLEKVSWLITLMTFHVEDMYQYIIDWKILELAMMLLAPKFDHLVRSNAMLAISLMTYNEKLFKHLIDHNVIDKLLDNCRDPNTEIEVKFYSTQALVHFALNKNSINILIQRGIMDLFSNFNQDHKEIGNIDRRRFQAIQLNISWIFLALCCNGITGKEMLQQGITLDMFLVSCNSNQFDNTDIRHLVITAFAELGKFEDKVNLVENNNSIRETAIFMMHEASQIDQSSKTIIQILLKFAAADQNKCRYTAYWSLKDYIFQNHEKLSLQDEGHSLGDISNITEAFLTGCYSEDIEIQDVCANAISFLITQHLIYRSRHEVIRERSPESNDGNQQKFEVVRTISNSKFEAMLEEIKSETPTQILDAIMFLSGSESTIIRSIAFSILSSLSTYSSQFESVMAQIQRDSQTPDNCLLSGKSTYFNFIKNRLISQQELFKKRFQEGNAEIQYSGLYSLLRLAQDPSDNAVLSATDSFLEFIEVLKAKQAQSSALKGTGHLPEGSQNRGSIRTYKQQREQEDLNIRRHLATNGVHQHRTPQIEADQKYLYILDQNQNFFMKVFQAVKRCKSAEILIKMLRIISFYIDNNQSQFQQHVINPGTIIWLLQIQREHIGNQQLCCMCAMTLLEIVDKHEIHIDYQEVEIVKLFRNVLTEMEILVDDQALAPAAKDIQEESSQQTSLKTEFDVELSHSLVSSNVEQVEKHQRDQEPAFLKNDCPDVDGQSEIKEQEILNARDARAQDKHAVEDEPDSLREPLMTPRAQKLRQVQMEVQEAPQISVDAPSGSITNSNSGSMKEAINHHDGLNHKGSVSAPRSSNLAVVVKPESAECKASLAPSIALPIEQVTDLTNRSSNKRRKADLRRASMQGSYSQVIPGSLLAKRNQRPEVESSRSRDAKNRLDAPQLKTQRTSKAINFAKLMQGGSPLLKHKDAQDGDLQPKPAQKAAPQKGRSLLRLSFQVDERKLQSQRDPLQFSRSMTGAAEFQANRSDCGSETDFLLKSKTLEDRLNDMNHNTDEARIHEMYQDAIIKSFMLIFANDYCQHLLLNEDLIVLAFNCLEYSTRITLEAQNNVAKLLAKVMKYPAIQARMLEEGSALIYGISSLLDLLSQSQEAIQLLNLTGDSKGCSKEAWVIRKKLQTIQYILQACTYFSMNGNFVAQHTDSIVIMNSLLRILKSRSIMSILSFQDKLNIIHIIKNMVKGPYESKKHFYNNKGISLLTSIVLKGTNFHELENDDGRNCAKISKASKSPARPWSKDVESESTPDAGLVEEIQFLDFCLEAISEQASSKRIVQEIIKKDDEYQQIVMVLKRSLELSQAWNCNIKQYDPFDPSYVSEGAHPCKKIMRRNNPLFTSNDHIQELLNDFGNRDVRYQKAATSRASSPSSEGPSNGDHQITKEQQDLINQLKNALIIQKQKYETHMRLTQIRTNSYFLMARLVKYKDLTSDTTAGISRELIESFIPMLMKDLQYLSVIIEPQDMVRATKKYHDEAESKQTMAERFNIKLQGQFDQIFENILKVLCVLQKNQQTIWEVLSVKGSNNKTNREILFKVMKDIKQQSKRQSLLLILCGFINNFIGPENTNFLEYSVNRGSNFKLSELIENLFLIDGAEGQDNQATDLDHRADGGSAQSSQSTLELALWILTQVYKQHSESDHVLTRWSILQSICRLQEQRSEVDLVQILIKNLRSSDNSKIITMSLDLTSSMVKEIHLVQLDYLQLKHINLETITDILMEIVEVADLLNEEWIQRFQIEQQPKIKVAVCQILFLLEDSQEGAVKELQQHPEELEANQSRSKQNAMRFNISIIKQALEGDYFLRASDDNEFDVDEVDIDSQLSDQAPDQSSSTRKLVASPTSAKDHSDANNGHRDENKVLEHSNIQMTAAEESKNEITEDTIQSIETAVGQITHKEVDVEMLEHMIQNGLLQVCWKFVYIYNRQKDTSSQPDESQSARRLNSNEEELEQKTLEILDFPSGAITMIQNISKIIHDISQICRSCISSHQLSKALMLLHRLVLHSEHDLLSLVNLMISFIDYDVQSMLFATIGNLLMPTLDKSISRELHQLKLEIQAKVISYDFLLLVLRNIEEPTQGWLKISRLSHQLLSQIQTEEPYLFKLNSDYLSSQHPEPSEKSCVPSP